MKKVRGVIFDLDMTLVDTSKLKDMRSVGDWPRVYHSLSETRLYPGALAFVRALQKDCKCGVVTSSPRIYAERLIEHHNLRLTVLAAYHDTALHKPNSDPIALGIKKLGLTPDEVVSIGDEPGDIIASKAAGASSIGVTWGSATKAELSGAQPSNLIGTFQELTALFKLPARDNPSMGSAKGFSHFEKPSPTKTPLAKSEILFEVSSNYPYAESAYHIAYYRPKGTKPDKVSTDLLAFKKNLEPQTARWIQLGAKVASDCIDFDLVMRVLGSKELVANGTKSLDRLCVELARLKGVKYQSNYLRKIHATPELKYLSAADRKLALKGVYVFENEDDLSGKKVLLVDDVITSGSSTRAIVEAIKLKAPAAKVILFALAKTSHDKFNTHLPEGYFSSPTPVSIVTKTQPSKEIRSPVERILALGKLTHPEKPVLTVPLPKPAAPPLRAPTVPRPPVYPSGPAPRSPIVTPPTATSSRSKPAPPVKSATIRSPIPAAIPVVERQTSGVGQVQASVQRAHKGGAGQKRRARIAAAFGNVTTVAAMVLLVVNLAGERPPASDPPGNAAIATSRQVSSTNQKAIQKKTQHVLALGSIAVPEIVLRIKPGFDAAPSTVRIVQDTEIEILIRRAADSGPDWYYVVAKGVGEGWIPVSAVTVESKGATSKSGALAD